MILNKIIPRPFFIVVGLILFITTSCSENAKNSSNKKVATFTTINEQADSLYTLARSYANDSLMYKQAIELRLKAVELYKEAKNKANVAKTYKWIGFAYDSLEDFEMEIKYLQKAFAINKELNNNVEVAIIVNYIGIAHTIMGNIDSAINYYNIGLDHSFTIGDTSQLIELYQNIGITYQYSGAYEKAIGSHIEALKFCELTNSKSGIFSMNLNLAQDYQQSGDSLMFFSYLEKANEFVNEINDSLTQASFYHTYAKAYCKKGDLKNAHKYYNKTLALSKTLQFKRGLAAGYSGLAEISLSQNNLKDAEVFALLSLSIEKEICNTTGVVESLIRMAEIYKQQKKNSFALYSLEQAKELCISKGLNDLLVNVYYEYYQTYKSEYKYKLALTNIENFYNLKDSLAGTEVKEKIADIEIKYQTQKKQQQIKLLDEENKTKKQKLIARNWLILSLTLIVILILSIGLLLRNKGLRKLGQMELELQKYILTIKDLDKDENSEPEINSKEFALKHELTDRETEVLLLLTQGISNADIGNKIFVSTNTIKYHIKNIYLKLDVKNRVEALNKLKQSA